MIGIVRLRALFLLWIVFTPLCDWVNAQRLEIELLTAGGMATGDFIWDIEFDHEGKLWACTENGDLFYFSAGEWTTVELPDPSIEELREMAFNSDNELWLVTDGYGILHFDGVEWGHYTMENSSLMSNSFNSVAIDDQGVVYAASRFDAAGLNRFDGDDWTVFMESNSDLVSNWIYDIAIDKDGVSVWLGLGDFDVTTTKFSNGNWFHYNFYEIFGDIAPRVESIRKDDAGVIWFATSVGLISYDQASWEFYREYSEGRNIHRVALDQAGNIWMYELFKGLLQYDGLTLFEYPASDTLPSQIFDIIVDSADYKYVMGNRGSSIIKFKEADLGSNVTELELSETVFLFPLPAFDRLRVEFIAKERMTYQYSILNVHGELLLDGQIISSAGEVSLEIDISSLTSGVYVLNLSSVHSSFVVHKFLKL